MDATLLKTSSAASTRRQKDSLQLICLSFARLRPTPVSPTSHSLRLHYIRTRRDPTPVGLKIVQPEIILVLKKQQLPRMKKVPSLPDLVQAAEDELKKEKLVRVGEGLESGSRIPRVSQEAKPGPVLLNRTSHSLHMRDTSPLAASPPATFTRSFSKKPMSNVSVSLPLPPLSTHLSVGASALDGWVEVSGEWDSPLGWDWDLWG
jgi:hypothetical protein